MHPNDKYAKEKENGQNGKIELWCILDAQKNAKIVYGLHHKLNKDAFIKKATDGSIKYSVQKINVSSDDVFLIEPGLTHAIGEGIFLAEIQESSNLTYRIYDYDRVDKNVIKEFFI